MFGTTYVGMKQLFITFLRVWDMICSTHHFTRQNYIQHLSKKVPLITETIATVIENYCIGAIPPFCTSIIRWRFTCAYCSSLNEAWSYPGEKSTFEVTGMVGHQLETRSFSVVATPASTTQNIGCPSIMTPKPKNLLFYSLNIWASRVVQFAERIYLRLRHSVY